MQSSPPSKKVIILNPSKSAEVFRGATGRIAVRNIIDYCDSRSALMFSISATFFRTIHKNCVQKRKNEIKDHPVCKIKNHWNYIYDAAISYNPYSLNSLFYSIKILGLAGEIRNASRLEILCLSGDLLAVQRYFFNNFIIDQNGLFDENGIERRKQYCDNDHRLSPKVLHYAAGSGNVDVLQFLFEKVKIKDPDQDSRENTLHFAAGRGSINCIRYAISSMKISGTSLGYNGCNALHRAARSGSVPAMECLVNEFKLPWIQDETKRYPLSYAIWSSNKESIQYCRSHNNPILADHFNYTALHFAVYAQSVETMAYTVNTLHVSKSARTVFGADALMLSASIGYFPGVKYAVEELKLYPYENEIDNALLYHCAAFSCNVAILKYFNETLGVPFNYQDEQHKHLFCDAVKGCSEETIYYLRQLNYKYDLHLDRSFNSHDNVHSNCLVEEYCRNNLDKYKHALFSKPLPEVMKMSVASLIEKQEKQKEEQEIRSLSSRDVDFFLIR